MKSAFTLVEVVIGLMLLATLMVTLLLSISRQKRMAELTDSRQQAIAIADDMLANWIDSPNGVPLGRSGIVPSQPSWLWQTSVLRTNQLFGRPVSVARFEIFENRGRNRPAKLVTVELALETRAGGAAR